VTRHVVYRARSPLSGPIKVVDVGEDRRLMLDGAVLSTYARDGDWSRARKEYWGEALAMVDLPPRPSVLFVGLGGGTQLHLLREQAAPREVIAIERDPVIVHIAQRWFGLGEIPRLEFLCAEAEAAVEALARARRRFDFIMEDCTYDETAARSVPLAVGLARLVSARGTLIVNRHRRPHAQATATALAEVFRRVRMRRIRREADNILVCASRPFDAAAEPPPRRPARRRPSRSPRVTPFQ
jgi:spermidine synthase